MHEGILCNIHVMIIVIPTTLGRTLARTPLPSTSGVISSNAHSAQGQEGKRVSTCCGFVFSEPRSSEVCQVPGDRRASRRR